MKRRQSGKTYNTEIWGHALERLGNMGGEGENADE